MRESEAYLKQHPELMELLNDFMSSLLLQKPVLDSLISHST